MSQHSDTSSNSRDGKALSIVEECLGEEEQATGYEESLELFQTVLDKLDEYTNNNNNSNHNSINLLSSNQSHTLINSLSRINNSTISSIILEPSVNDEKNKRDNNHVKMDSEYIIKELLKRRKEYRTILNKKQKLLRENKKLSTYKINNNNNTNTNINNNNSNNNNNNNLIHESSSKDSTEERLRQFQEFSNAQQKTNITNDNYEIYDNKFASLLNKEKENEFQIDNLHNYNFNQDHMANDTLFRTKSIESWSQDEVLENYDEILENYLLYTTKTNASDQLIKNDSILLDENNSQFFNNSIFSKAPAKQSLKMSLLVGLIVALGGLVYGFDSGLINNLIGMSYFIKHFETGTNNGFTTPQISIIVTSLSIGTFTGALFAPFSMDRVGRKPTIITSVWVFLVIGNIVQITATRISIVIVGRLISGFGVGILSAAIPNYQSEISHKNIRGAIICTFQWAITWGLLLSSVVSQGTHNMQTKASYQIPMGLQFLWAFLLGIGMFYLPESPRYYVMKGQLNKAAESLSFVRGVPITDTGLLEELVEVKANYDYETSLVTNGGILDCFRNSPTRYKQGLRIFTAVCLQIFQQMSGINFIFYYGVSFFQKTGIQSTYILSLITYAVNVAFNIPGLFLIDLIGRRQLLIWGAIIMTVSNYLVAIISTVKMPSSLSNKGLESLKLCFICSFIGSFSATFGGCTWVVSAEIFPLGIRSQCISISAAANWLANVVCAAITPFIFNEGANDSRNKKYAHSQIFFLWASLNLVAIFVVWFLVYETSGLTLEEIDELYTNSKNARDSVRVNKSIKCGDSYMTGFLTLAKAYKNKRKNKNVDHFNKKNKNGSEENDEFKALDHAESDLGDRPTVCTGEGEKGGESCRNLYDDCSPHVMKGDNAFFEMVAAKNKENSENSETQNESTPEKDKLKEDEFVIDDLDLGNGLAITGFPRSIPSTTGLSTSFNPQTYTEDTGTNIIDANDVKMYLDMKDQKPFIPVHPIFIANQGISGPPQLSSDEEEEEEDETNNDEERNSKN